MRNIWTILALTMAVGCGGGDGKDGADGAPGAAGPAGEDGTDGSNGINGTNGTDGDDGADGAPGAKGDPGAAGDDGADGGAILKGAGAPAAGVGVDGDLYIDTVSRDVYQKAGGAWSVITNLSGGPAGPKGDPGTPGTNGADGDDGADGASVRTGSGAPAAGLGSLGDVYIDSATGDLYSKGAGGWTKTGNLKGPAGADGADGADGAGVTLRGADWFAFALTAAFADAPQLITSEAYTETSSTATFTFTGGAQHGRMAFQTAGSFLPGGVNLSSFEAISLSASLTGGAATKLIVVLADGTKKGCQWDLAIAAGPVYSVDLSTPTSCFNTSLGDPAFALDSVTQIQIGVQSSAAGARTLTIDDIDFVDSL